MLKAMLEHLPESHEAHGLISDADSSVALTQRTSGHQDPNFDNEIKLHWDYVKRYDGFEDVDFIETIITALPEEDYMLVRLGEDQDDNEQRGDYWDSDIHITRSISW